uniref:THD domain-containing protein n=1 Tax=Chelydra serpentina TaxID=8475 RepID=A0A8C3XLL4_CHESE
LPSSGRGVGAGGLEQGELGGRTPGFSPRLWEGSGVWWLEQGGLGAQTPGFSPRLWEGSGPGRLGSLPGSERGVGAGGLEQGGLGARTPGFSPRLWEGSRGWWVRAGGGQDPGDANSPPPISPADEGDMTEIWWQPFLQQGRVLFHDPTFTMGQVLWRASPGGPGQILLRCVQSMPREPEQAYNSCYSGGVFQLQRGDQLSLRVPRANASLDLSPHGTFLGLVRL